MGPITRYWRPLAILAAVVFVGVAACADLNGPGRSGDGDASVAPIVAATVNGKPIYISDVEAEATVRGLIREGEDFDTTSDEFYQILEDLIETRLFAMEAETRQLDRNADVRHRLERARELILAGALNDQIRETALDEAAVERMYREQARLRRSGREAHIRHALFATKEAAQTAKRRLDAGVSTFEEVAYLLSIDRVTGAEGGDMGFQQIDSLPDGVREAASATAVGQVAGPFQSAAGWHLLKVEQRREQTPPSIEAMRPRIEQWLMFEEQRRLVEKLKAQARIERIMEESRGVAAGPDLPAPASRPKSEVRRRDPQSPMGPGGIAGPAASGVAAPAIEPPADAAAEPAPAPAPLRRKTSPAAPPPEVETPPPDPTTVPAATPGERET